MGTDVNAVSQTADDEYLGTQLLQFFHEALHQILSIGRAMTGAHHVDDPLLVEVCRSFIE